MKQYVQTDLEADRQVANTLAALITGGSLASLEVRTTEGVAALPCTNPFARGKQKAGSLFGSGLWLW
jgi:hypothetical protein